MRTQTIEWYTVEEKLPEINRVVLIKVPGRPWLWSNKGDIKQDVAYRVECEVGGNYRVPYCYKTFGPAGYFAHEVTEWAYLD